MKRCPDCKTENVATAKFCRNCGYKFVDKDTIRLDPDPPPPTPTPAPLPAPTPQPDKRQPNRRTLLLAGGALGVLLLAGLVWGALQLLGGRGGSHIVLLEQQRSDSWDVLALRPGAEIADAQVLATAIDFNGPGTTLVLAQGDEFLQANPDINVAFVPGGNQVLLLLADEGEALLQQAQLGRDEVTTLYETRSHLTALFDTDTNRFLLEERRDSGPRCYTLRAGERESRVGRSDSCSFNMPGRTLLSIDEDDDSFVLTASDADGGNAVELINAEQRVSYRLASDGAHLAYVEPLSNGEQLYLVTRSSGGTGTPISMQYARMAAYEFAADRRDVLYYIGETDEGALELLTTRSDVPLATGELLGAAISADGNHLVYATGEYGDMQAFAVDLGSGSAAAIVRGDNLSVATLDDRARLLVIDETQDGELVLTTSNMAGGDVVTILSEDGVLNALYALDGGQLLINVSDDAGNSLYFSATAAEQSTLIADGWAYFNTVHIDADAGFLALVGVEENGDPEGLYGVELNGDRRPLLLDEEDVEFFSVVLTADRRSVLYTVGDGNDYEVRQVLRDGSERPEVLYRDAVLAATQWADISAQPNWVDWVSPYTSSIPCPGAPPLALDSQTNDSLSARSETDCYRIAVSAAELLTLRATAAPDSNLDLTLTILDRAGQQIAYSDDAVGRDPRISQTFPAAATYFVQVAQLGDRSGDYTLAYAAGPGDPAFAAAASLPFDTRTRGAITGRTYFAMYDDEIAANTYYFDGRSGATVQIDAFASSLGSTIDPVVYLYDAALNELGNNDDGGDGNDARLTYRLRADGRYYIMVYNLRDEIGSADTHFYELLLRR